jgi:chorismate mutase
MKSDIDNFFAGNKNDKPFFIAGPCSAESEEQVFKTVESIAHEGISLVRAGIWKPRTRPDSFEGRGAVALKWLKDAGNYFNLPVTVEVANSEHVDAALHASIDVLWIGARTTVNPFMVQELADSLRGVDIPVMIKNPLNPDLELWIGAMERLQHAGINKIAAIHRGFSSYENSMYRYKPNWELPIEFRRRHSQIPMICDPSHICGTTETIQYVSQTALDLGYNGLMIETHIDPAHAMSDAKQQLTPAQLKNLLLQLVQRQSSSEDVFEKSKLQELRNLVDEIDSEVIDILSRRMDIARLIGEFKLKNNVAILQPERWDEIIRTRTAYGSTKDLSREFLLKLYSIIHEESILQQSYKMNLLQEKS